MALLFTTAAAAVAVDGAVQLQAVLAVLAAEELAETLIHLMLVILQLVEVQTQVAVVEVPHKLTTL
jgi:hypothetical protein